MNLVCLPRLVLGRGVKDPLHSSAATRVRPGVLSVFSFSPDENFFLLLVVAVDFAIFGVCLCGRLRECQENVSICSVKESTHQIMKGKRAGSIRLNLYYYIYQYLHCGDCMLNINPKRATNLKTLRV